MTLASQLSEEHLRAHRQAKRKIKAAISPFFVAQTQWVLDSIDTKQPIVAELVGAGFDHKKAHEDLIARLTVMQDVAETAAEGVVGQFSQPVSLETKLLFPMIATIKTWIDRVLVADWWHEVVDGGWKAAQKIITNTIEKTGPIALEAADKFKRKLGTRVRKLTKFRVDGIADGQANAAINIGKEVAGETIAQTTGATDAKTWITMADERVRGSHRANHMVTIPAADNFNVGGYPAPHPGHWELPIGERIHCRCFLAFGGVEDDIEFPIPEELRQAV